MGWPDGHTIVGNWNGKGNPSVDARYHAPDGLAGRPHDRGGLDLIAGGEQSYHQRDRIYSDHAPALDAYGDTPSDAPLIAGTLREHVRPGSNTDLSVLTGGGVSDDPMLPAGLDSNRYRCCGNGVVADVAFWIGQRLAEIA